MLRRAFPPGGVLCWLLSCCILISSAFLAGCSRSNYSSESPGLFSRELSGDYTGYLSVTFDPWPPTANSEVYFYASHDIFKTGNAQERISDLNLIQYRVTPSGGTAGTWKPFVRESRSHDHARAYEHLAAGSYVFDFKFGTTVGQEFTIDGVPVEIMP